MIAACVDLIDQLSNENNKPIDVLMSILSNYVPECLVHAEVSCPIKEFNLDNNLDIETFTKRMIQAVAIAKYEPYRAVTHNKGIMNGVDSLVIATGNDFRAIEAGVHAYAARSGQYRSLSDAYIKDDQFVMELSIPLALGTDTGGSVRIPAAFCGVTGHKPTYGLIGKSGIIPLSKTLDHAGPMARTAFDCALLLNQMTGEDINDPHNINFDSSTDFTRNIEGDITGTTLAVIPSLLVDSEIGVVESFTKSIAVLEQMGVNITEIEPTSNNQSKIKDSRRYDSEISWGDPLPSIIRNLSPILLSEGSTYIENILRTNPNLIGQAVRERMMKGIDISVHDYIRALDWRKEIEGRFERCLLNSTIDGYVVPTSPQVAEPIASDPHVGMEPDVKFRNTSVFNHTRQPSISVPNGFNSEGLPTGLMITTAQKNDALALRLAHQYQLNTDFHLSRPSMNG